MQRRTAFAVKSLQIAHGVDESTLPPLSEASPCIVRHIVGSRKVSMIFHLLRANQTDQLTALLTTSESLRICVGDDTELTADPDAMTYVNVTVFDVNLVTGEVTGVSSLVGLPPVFALSAGRSHTISCPFYPSGALGSSRPNIEAVADTLRWGHPLDGRTLHDNISVIAANAEFRLHEGSLSVFAKPNLASRISIPQDDEARLRAQMAAFLRTANRLPLDGAFLSLSGGLDSRTALMGVLTSGRRVHCVTLAGSPASLDARLANAFCEAYGLSHQVIELGKDFVQQLPGLVQTSARLTHGVSSLSQAIDVYLYKNISAKPLIRISGNLGNQVGRGGVESISTLTPFEPALDLRLREALAKRPVSPWYTSRMAQLGYGEVLFSQEVHFWSIANYVAGSAYALQLSPYADVELIGLTQDWLRTDPQFSNVTAQHLRRRDLKHRAAGAPSSQSFQRKFLIDHDIRGCHVPINWGWLATGGWSPRWIYAAGATAADAAALKLSVRSPKLKAAAERFSAWLGRPSAFVNWPLMLRTALKEVCLDTLLSADFLQCGLVQPLPLQNLLNDHFSGVADHHATTARLFEIALGLQAARS